MGIVLPRAALARKLFAAVNFLIGMTFGVLSLEAQTASGRVVSADSIRGIPAAIVEVFDAEGDRITTTLTDGAGRFEVSLQRGGEPFRLLVHALAFDSASVDLPPLPASEALVLADITLNPAPIPLEEIRAEAERPRVTPGREWVRRHQLLGKGTFIAGAMLAADEPHSVAQYLSEQTQLWVSYDARGQPRLYNPGGFRRCVDVLVNRWPIDRTTYRTIDEIPQGAIAAIEIYENVRDLPPWYSFEGRPGCGIVQVWLWNSW